jgi:hypothetical protein
MQAGVGDPDPELPEVVYFAIFMDGARAPRAAFAAIEDAFDWACRRLGSAPFRIRAFPLIPGAGPVQRGRLVS